MIRSAKFVMGISVPAVLAESKKDKEKTPPPPPPLKLRPSEIPIYDHDLFKLEYHAEEKGKLHQGVSTVRKEMQSLAKATKETRDSICHFYETGKAHTLSSIDYVMAEENVAARAGAISAGGLIGLLTAVRKGFFRKIFYTSIGAGAVASLCYPKHAYQISEEVVDYAKVYGLIGYNFIVGAKPQTKEPTSSESKPTPATPPKEPAAAPTPKASPPPAPKEETSPPQPASEAPSVSPEKTHLATEKTPPPAAGEDAPKKEASKDIVIKIAESVQQTITGDIGQSNPADRDMYTTRGK